jgi:hypothetical protein
MQVLREKVEREEKSKVKFLEDLIALKSKCKHLQV